MRVGAALAAALIAALPAPVLPQTPPAPPQPAICAAHADITARLAGGYGERLQARGLLRSGQMLEIWASATGRASWSILVVRPDGIACIVSAGEGWLPDALDESGEKL